MYGSNRSGSPFIYVSGILIDFFCTLITFNFSSNRLNSLYDCSFCRLLLAIVLLFWLFFCDFLRL